MANSASQILVDNKTPDPASKERLRLWLRLLRASRQIETELRERLRLEFGTTLPRFDVLAALYRNSTGMLMSELSRHLMVSNGNVTGIVDRLVADKLVTRTSRQGDRRASIVQLTPLGHESFGQMAAAHETWVDELLSAFSPNQAQQLVHLLEDIGTNRPLP